MQASNVRKCVYIPEEVAAESGASEQVMKEEPSMVQDILPSDDGRIPRKIQQRANNSATFEPLLDSDEAAALLQIHPKTLQKMARNGEITGVQIGKLWRFHVSAECLARPQDGQLTKIRIPQESARHEIEAGLRSFPATRVASKQEIE
jgi:excisionase family DNA binding protein